LGGALVVIELCVAVAAFLVMMATLWRYEARPVEEWEDLLSPAAREAHDALRKVFRGEEAAVTWAASRDALAEGPDVLAELVPGRLALIGRLRLYTRLAAALAPPEERLRTRLLLLRRSFAALLRAPAADRATAFRSLDQETLESLQLVLNSIAK
jgi:hypothetical protein